MNKEQPQEYIDLDNPTNLPEEMLQQFEDVKAKMDQLEEMKQRLDYDTLSSMMSSINNAVAASQALTSASLKLCSQGIAYLESQNNSHENESKNT